MESESSDATEQGISPSIEYTISPAHSGLRLDHYLVSRFPELSRSLIALSIKSGEIQVNDSPAKASKKLRSGDRISGRIRPATPLSVEPQKIDFDILFEDDSLLLLNKPPGLVVHPADGNPDNTLVNGLLYHCQNISVVGDPVRPGIVHRLDKDTSGVMVVAKTADVHRSLVDSFKEKRVKKKYIAILRGIPKEHDGRIVAPIGRHPVNRKKMAVSLGRGKFAASSWEIVEVLGNSHCLAEVCIETGRTHQIRVHMAYIGHHVAGDCVYCKPGLGKTFPRQMLHASEIRFEHPLTGRKIIGKAPLFSDMEKALDMLREDEE